MPGMIKLTHGMVEFLGDLNPPLPAVMVPLSPGSVGLERYQLEIAPFCDGVLRTWGLC